ncbi:unnamed protein product [Boreogadus saida]
MLQRCNRYRESRSCPSSLSAWEEDQNNDGEHGNLLSRELPRARSASAQSATAHPPLSLGRRPGVQLLTADQELLQREFFSTINDLSCWCRLGPDLLGPLWT